MVDVSVDERKENRIKKINSKSNIKSGKSRNKMKMHKGEEELSDTLS